LRSHQNRKGAEVGFARETRRRNLRRIPPPKSEHVGRAWNPTTSLVINRFSLVPRSHRLTNGATGKLTALFCYGISRLIRGRARDEPLIAAPPRDAHHPVSNSVTKACQAFVPCSKGRQICWERGRIVENEVLQNSEEEEITIDWRCPEQEWTTVG